jgi:predicted amidohydrolase
MEGLASQELWSSLNVAVVQYPLVGRLSVEQLFYKVKSYVDTASAAGSQLIILPELFSLDMLVDFENPVPEFNGIIRALFPEFIKQLTQLAAEKNVYLLAGSLPVIIPETKKIRNRSYLFSPDGKSVYQEKMFLTPEEVEWGWEATDTLNIIKAPWGTTAITICYDSEFPLVFQTLAGNVVDVVLVPSMTEETGFTRVRWSAQARTVEHMAYVLVTGVVGAPAPGWEMTGQGAVLGPSLTGFTPTIAEGVMDAADYIVYASLDMKKLRDAKATEKYYPAYDQRNVTLETTSSAV